METAWNKFVDSVLANVEPNEPRRGALRQRLHKCLGTLHSMWATGADLTKLGKMLAEQAREAR